MFGVRRSPALARTRSSKLTSDLHTGRPQARRGCDGGATVTVASGHGHHGARRGPRAAGHTAMESVELRDRLTHWRAALQVQGPGPPESQQVVARGCMIHRLNHAFGTNLDRCIHVVIDATDRREHGWPAAAIRQLCKRPTHCIIHWQPVVMAATLSCLRILRSRCVGGLHRNRCHFFVPQSVTPAHPTRSLTLPQHSLIG